LFSEIHRPFDTVPNRPLPTLSMIFRSEYAISTTLKLLPVRPYTELYTPDSYTECYPFAFSLLYPCFISPCLTMSSLHTLCALKANGMCQYQLHSWILAKYHSLCSRGYLAIGSNTPRVALIVPRQTWSRYSQEFVRTSVGIHWLVQSKNWISSTCILSDYIFRQNGTCKILLIFVRQKGVHKQGESKGI